MNKKIIFSLVLVGVLGLAGATMAQGLFDPLRGQTITGPNGLITKITKMVFDLITALAVLMFLFAGILFLFSAGDPGKINKAKDAVKYAVIGVIIGLSGEGMILVLKQILGVK